MPKLSPDQIVLLQATLQKSSHKEVERVFSLLGIHFPLSQWLDVNNRYRVDCVRFLSQDTKSGNTVNCQDLSAYIAASAPLHCLDGWTFLGRAVDSHIRRDSHSSRHLAYYAELRAAISLLATEGIGIFSKRHFVLDVGGNCQQLAIGAGTHEITWLALQYWAGLSNAANLLADVFSPGGIPLFDWVDSFGASPSLSAIMYDLLKTWGLDLQRLSDDHDARNEASYRPTYLNNPSVPDLLYTSKMLRSLWIMFEPAAPGQFEVLDNHLLRLTLEVAHRAVTGNDVADDSVEFEKRVSQMLNDLKPGSLSQSQWLEFLMRRVEPDDLLVLGEARGTLPKNHVRHHIQVIGRAALLLRVASGACARLIRDAGFGSRDLEFWWRPIGEDLGLWDPEDAVTELSDLWLDVQAALNDIETWETTNERTGISQNRWKRELSYPLSVLGSCERIGLWGLGL